MVVVLLLIALAMTFDAVRTPCIRGAQGALSAWLSRGKKQERVSASNDSEALEARIDALEARMLNDSTAREADLAQVLRVHYVGGKGAGPVWEHYW